MFFLLTGHGKYVRTQNNGKFSLCTTTGEQEIFRFDTYHDGTISIRTYNGSYLSASPDLTITCTRHCSSSEKFKKEFYGVNNIKVALKTFQDTYVSALDTPNETCLVQQIVCMEKERFQLVPVVGSPSSPLSKVSSSLHSPSKSGSTISLTSQSEKNTKLNNHTSSFPNMMKSLQGSTSTPTSLSSSPRSPRAQNHYSTYNSPHSSPSNTPRGKIGNNSRYSLTGIPQKNTSFQNDFHQEYSEENSEEDENYASQFDDYSRGKDIEESEFKKYQATVKKGLIERFQQRLARMKQTPSSPIKPPEFHHPEKQDSLNDIERLRSDVQYLNDSMKMMELEKEVQNLRKQTTEINEKMKKAESKEKSTRNQLERKIQEKDVTISQMKEKIAVAEKKLETLSGDNIKIEKLEHEINALRKIKSETTGNISNLAREGQGDLSEETDKVVGGNKQSEDSSSNDELVVSVEKRMVEQELKLKYLLEENKKVYELEYLTKRFRELEQQKDATINQLNESIREKELKISDLLSNSKNQSDAIYTQKIEELSAKLYSLELEKKNIDINLHEKLKKKEDVIQELSQKIEQMIPDHDNRISLFESEIEKLNGELLSLRSEKETFVNNLKSQIEDQNEVISKLKESLKQTDEKHSLYVEQKEKEVKVFQKDAEMMSAELSLLREEKENYSTVMISLREKIEKLKDEQSRNLFEMNESIQIFKKEAIKAEETIAMLNNQLKCSEFNLKKISDDKEAEIQNLQRELQDISAKYTSIREENESRIPMFQKEIDYMHNHIESIVSEKDNSISVLQSDVISEREKNYNLNKTIEKLEQDFQSTVESKQKEIDRLQDVITETCQKKDTIQNQNNSFAKKISDLEIDVARLKEEIAVVSSENEQLNEKIAHKQQMISKIEEDLSSEKELYQLSITQKDQVISELKKTIKKFEENELISRSGFEKCENNARKLENKIEILQNEKLLLLSESRDKLSMLEIEISNEKRSKEDLERKLSDAEYSFKKTIGEKLSEIENLKEQFDRQSGKILQVEKERDTLLSLEDIILERDEEISQISKKYNEDLFELKSRNETSREEIADLKHQVSKLKDIMREMENASQISLNNYKESIFKKDEEIFSMNQLFDKVRISFEDQYHKDSEKINELQKELSGLREKLDHEIAKHNEEVDNLQKIINHKHQNILTLDDEVKRKDERLKMQKEHIGRFNEELEFLKTCIQKMKSHTLNASIDLQKDISLASEMLNKQRDKINLLELQLREKNELISEKDIEISLKSKDIFDLRQKLSISESMQIDLKKSKADLETNIEKLGKQVSKLERELSNESCRTKSLENSQFMKICQKDSEIESLKGKLRTVELEQARMKSEYENHLADKEMKVSEVTNKLEEMRLECESLVEKYKAEVFQLKREFILGKEQIENQKHEIVSRLEEQMARDESTISELNLTIQTMEKEMLYMNKQLEDVNSKSSEMINQKEIEIEQKNRKIIEMRENFETSNNEKILSIEGMQTIIEDQQKKISLFEEDVSKMKQMKEESEKKVCEIENELEKLRDSILIDGKEKSELRASIESKNAMITRLRDELKEEKGKYAQMKIVRNQEDFENRLKSALDRQDLESIERIVNEYHKMEEKETKYEIKELVHKASEFTSKIRELRDQLTKITKERKGNALLQWISDCREYPCLSSFIFSAHEEVIKICEEEKKQLQLKFENLQQMVQEEEETKMKDEEEKQKIMELRSKEEENEKKLIYRMITKKLEAKRTFSLQNLKHGNVDKNLLAGNVSVNGTVKISRELITQMLDTIPQSIDCIIFHKFCAAFRDLVLVSESRDDYLRVDLCLKETISFVQSLTEILTHKAKKKYAFFQRTFLDILTAAPREEDVEMALSKYKLLDLKKISQERGNKDEGDLFVEFLLSQGVLPKCVFHILKQNEYLKECFESSSLLIGNKTQAYVRMIMLELHKIYFDLGFPSILFDKLAFDLSDHIKELRRKHQEWLSNSMYVEYICEKVIPLIEKLLMYDIKPLSPMGKTSFHIWDVIEFSTSILEEEKQTASSSSETNPVPVVSAYREVLKTLQKEGEPDNDENPKYSKFKMFIIYGLMTHKLSGLIKALIVDNKRILNSFFLPSSPLLKRKNHTALLNDLTTLCNLDLDFVLTSKQNIKEQIVLKRKNNPILCAIRTRSYSLRSIHKNLQGKLSDIVIG